jgi:hypothetical protein
MTFDECCVSCFLVTIRFVEDQIASAGVRRRFAVLDAPNDPRRLPMGTLLEEARRFEAWDNHGCIDPIRSIVAEMRVMDGPRVGEVVQITLESGYEYDPPFWTATWVAEIPE